jgi:prefoldin subunit 5
MIRKLFLLLTLLLSVIVTSCKAPPVNTVENAEEAVCKQIVLFTSSVKQLQDVSQFSDQTALQAQFDVVRKNFNNLRTSVSDLQNAQKDEFEKAVQTLMDKADSLPDNTSVSDALTTLKDPIQQVLDAAENLQTGLNCHVEP